MENNLLAGDIMKKISVLIVILLSMCVLKGKAQMPTAARVQWDLTRKLDLSMNVGEVWSIFHNAELLQKAGSGWIKAVEIKNAAMFPSIEMTLTDGSRRIENIDQDEPSNFLIVLSRSKESLLPAIRSVETGIFISEANKGSSIIWRFKIAGSQEAKKAQINQINQELDILSTGLKKMEN